VSVLSRYKLIVFDWDGTVADSLHGIVAAMKAAITDTRLPERESGAIMRIIGLGLDEATQYLYPDTGESVRDELIGNYRKHYLAATAKTVLYPHAEMTFTQLIDAGYLLAVATGKSRRGLDRAIADTNVRKYFHATRCADETISKPHPQMLYELMHTLDADPVQTVMIGDSEYDLQMAANAGVASVAVSYGAQPISHLEQFKPLTGIDCLSELPTWLNSQQPGNIYERPD